MKKLIALALSIVMMLSLCACGGKDDSTSNDYTDEPTDEEMIEDTETINFDLSQYKAYGELSCNRIWVIKEEASWDKSEDFFAFFDSDGNQITEWISTSESEITAFDKYDDNYERAKESVKYCYDKDGAYIFLKADVGYYMYDENFNLLLEDKVYYNERTEYNEEGIMLFKLGGITKSASYFYIDKKSMDKGEIWLDREEKSAETHMWHRLPSKLSNTSLVKIYAEDGIEKYVLMTEREEYGEGGISRAWVFTLNGDFVTDIDLFPQKLVSIENVIENERLKATIVGADGKLYSCYIDRNGEIDGIPTLVE